MSTAANLVALALALTLALVGAGVGASTRARGAAPSPPTDGYRRVACLIAHLDQVVVELAEPGRVVAVSAGDHGVAAARLAAWPRLDGLSSLEALLALHPDAVIASSFDARDARAATLRAAGIAVLDAGESRGMPSLLAGIALAGRVLGAEDRADALAHTFRRRMALVAARVSAVAPRRRGLYLASYGDRLFGGTVGTSYHDVLVAAGIDDLAAARWRDWPEYTAEDLIALDPPLIVTATGMGDGLRRRSGLAGLTACRDPRGIIELPSALIDDAGLGMLDAAEALCDAAYPEARPDP